MIENVKEFNKKFNLPLGDVDQLTGDRELQAYRVNFLQEELDELKLALQTGDMVGVFDALLDIVYVAEGTALFAGISTRQWNDGAKAVHDANMAKVRVPNLTDSKRKSAFDVTKPAGWTPPEAQLKSILRLG